MKILIAGVLTWLLVTTLACAGELINRGTNEKLIQNASFHKDYESFVRSVANDESIEVSNSRFKRILEKLKAVKK